MSFGCGDGRRREIPGIGVSLQTMPAANRPRAIWTGAISFGLVNAPVRMYTAITEKDLRFNQLHEPDGGRIGYVKVCKVDNEPVPADEIVKGYEISKGEYVQMTDEDFQAARGEQHRGITIHDFVPADRIDRSTSSARTSSAPRRARARRSTLCSSRRCSAPACPRSQHTCTTTARTWPACASATA